MGSNFFLKKFYVLIFVLLFVVIGSYFIFFADSYKFTEDRAIRVLVVHSYDVDSYLWTEGEMLGFNTSLDKMDDLGFDIDLKVFNMDTKRNPSNEWKEKSAVEAMKIIEEWDPDIVYLTDDNAQKYVGMNYLGSDILFVYSGVDNDPADYGYIKANNFAGVIERHHLRETVDLLKEFYPLVEKIGVIYDDSVTGELNAGNMIEISKGMTDVEFVEWARVSTFEEYKAKVDEYQESVDAILFLNIHTIKDENGKIIPSFEVAKWEIQNSDLPDICLHDYNILYGMLFGVPVSSFNQGYDAGVIVRKVLVDGIDPKNIPIKTSEIEKNWINLARAKQLGLDIPSVVLINSEVIEEFFWEEQ